MLVNRRTFVVKQGCMPEVVALIQSMLKKYPKPEPQRYRFYQPYIGPFAILAMEAEFESLDEYEKFWAEWGAGPQAKEWAEKSPQLLHGGGTNEIWTQFA